MTSQIKITQLTDIGSANLSVTTLLPVVNMAGVPTTQKTTLGNLANVILSQSGGNYAPVGVANLSYSVTNAAQPNITSVGTLTSLTVSGNVDLGPVANVRITGGSAGQILSTDGTGNLSWVSDANSTYGNANVVSLLAAFGSNTITTTGNVSAGQLIGNGHYITSLPGANVAGQVNYAAVANSVAGGNVSGEVAYANTANNVAGINVTGIVANANVANIAYSVSASNVTGLGNISTINLDGNASNVLRGDGTWGVDSANTGNIIFSGSNISTNTNNANLRINGFGTNSHVVITANGYGWTFEPYGNFGIPDGTVLGSFNSNNATGFNVGANNQFQIRTQDGNVYDWYFTQGGNFVTPGHILPDANITYDLGSPTQRWKDLWIANSTIYLGDLSLSVSNTGEVATSQLIDGGEGIGGISYVEWTTASTLSIRTDDTSAFIPVFESLKINDSFKLLTGGNGLVANTVISVSNTITQTTPVPGYVDFSIPVDNAPVSNVYVYLFNLTRAPVTEFSQLTGNTITLGNAVLTANGNTLVVNSIEVTDGNVGTIGNIASINLDGSSSNVLYGNGVFAPVTGGGGLPLANGNSNINIATANGPVTLTSAGQTWTIGTDGSLTAPNNSNIYPAGNNFNAFAPAAGSMQFYSDGGNFSWSLDGYGVMNLPFASAMSNTALIYSAGNLRLDAGANNFMFTDTGTVVFPTMTVDLHNGGNQYAQTLQFGDPTQQAVITGPTPAVDTNAQRLIIQGQRGNGTGEGGDVYFWAGDADTNGGDIKIYAGDADNVSAGYGGYINLDGGSGFDGGGQISVTGGYSTGGQGGPVYISAGQGTAGGVVNINGGGASANAGGYVNIQGGFGQSDGGAVTIAGGGSALGLPGYGNVQITAGVSTWTFDNAGVLNLPGGTGTIESTANNISIYSDAGQLNGALFYDTGAEIYALQDFAIFTDNANASHIWRFYANGNMTAPGAINVGNMVIGTVPGDITADANTGVTFNVSGPDGGFAVNYLDEVGNANTSGGELAFSSETGNTTYRISLSDDLGNGFATKIWRFDGTGNLVLAGGNSVIQSIANSSLDPLNPNVSTMTLTPDANYNGQALVLDPTAPGHIHLRAYASSNIDEPSANIFLGGENTSFEVTSGPNNEVRIHSNNYTWTYGTDGNLTLPGSLLPTSDGNYDLGSNANRWRDLYLSGNTIYLGANATISAMDDDILIGTPNIDLTFGGGAFTMANAANANNTFSIALFDDGADILVNGNQGNLTFGGGAFVMAANASIGFADANGNILGNILLADDDILINTGPGGNLVFTGGAFVANTTDLRIGNTPTPVVVPVGVPIPVATKFSVVDGSFQQGNGDMWTDGFLYAANGIYTGANISANNIGNISGINLDGSNSNVLYGNGVFAPGGGGGTPAGSNNQIQYNSNGVFAASGNYTFTDTVGGGTVTVGNELNLLGNGTIGTANGNLNIQPAGNVVVTTSIYSWVYNLDGTLSLPTSTYGYAQLYTTGANLYLGNSGNPINIQPDGTISSNANVSANVGLFNDLNLNNAGTNAFLYTDSNRNIYDTQFGYDSANDTMSGGNISLTGTISATNIGNISGINLDGNASNVLYGNGVFAAPTSGYGNSNVTTLLSSFGSNTISTTGNISGGNVLASGTSSNVIRRAFGLVASDVGVTLDDLTVTVSSSTSQLTLQTSGSWQGTGWTETFAGGATPTVNNWINLPLNPGFTSASGAMNTQGNGCRCIISDQTPSAKVYCITVVRSGTSGSQWNISIERLV